MAKRLIIKILLNKKHTIFGKVVGPSVFNLLDMQNVDLGENDRPINPPKIVKCVVVDNPYDDIVPRARKQAGVVVAPKAGAKETNKRKGVKNLGLISFGDEMEEGDDGDRGGVVPCQPTQKRQKPLLSSEPVVAKSSTCSDSRK